MKLVDLDRDHSQMFPAALTLDSAHLYARMAEVSYALLRLTPGDRLLDVAGGLGRDAQALDARGVRTVCLEPSPVMVGLARMLNPEGKEPARFVRGWAEAVPFATGSFEGVLCKGALDHFDDPRACIGELARVTRTDGRLVLAVANMDSLGLRVMRALERRGGARAATPGRRHTDVPSDHYTRYDVRLLLEHASEHLFVEECVGIQLFWGSRRWNQLLTSLSEGPRQKLVGFTDQLARWVPSWSDVVVVAGRPRRTRS